MRVSRLLLPLLFPLLALLPVSALFAGCTDEATAPERLPADAGQTACAPGTRACVCTNNGACNPGLLCISRRCLDTEGTPNEQEPEVRPTYRPPLITQPGLDAGSASSDGG